MKTARVQHSKYKNTGILFELLVRQVTADTLNSRKESPALRIIREFFNANTELGKELQLYRTLLETTNLSESKALRFLDLVLEQRRKLDAAKLNEEKYYLVKAISEAYPIKEFLSSKLPTYKICASIYKAFLCEVAPDSVGIANINEVAQSRFTIVEHMGTSVKGKAKTNATLLESFKEQDEAVRLLTYKILVDRFNEKYSGLDESQQVLLREYIQNISNTNSLREHINTEVPRVQQELRARMRGVSSKVVRIKLEEVANQLSSITRGKTVRDNQVTALMIAYELIKEIDSVIDDE